MDGIDESPDAHLLRLLRAFGGQVEAFIRSQIVTALVVHNYFITVCLKLLLLIIVIVKIKIGSGSRLRLVWNDY